MANVQERGRITRRVYKPTESLLTSNREKGNPYAEGLFNLATFHLLLLPLALIVRDLYDPGSLKHHVDGLYALIGGPNDLYLTALIFLLQFLISFCVYFCFLGWAACYRWFGRAANLFFLPPLVVGIIVYRYLLITFLLNMNFPPGARFGCCVHQLILFLKWISFIYENAYKVLYPWNKEDETGPAVWYAGQMEPQIGSFSSYVYFLFCPVLLYRDRYPRKPANLWKAFTYFIQFIALVWASYVILVELGIPESMHRDAIRRVALQNLFLGFLLMACAHTFLLHGWTNFWAELLGFADQSFYEDWWNTRSLNEYLRKWNPIIQEWLKAYVHRPLKKWLPLPLATLIVLLVSAFEHDFLLSAGLGYFMPVYLVQYGICGMLLSLKPPLSRWADQMIMCIGLSVGMGLQMTLYCTEVAAHIHCPDEEASWFGGLRMINCYRQFN
jgi:sterol O-acyltransferase